MQETPSTTQRQGSRPRANLTCRDGSGWNRQGREGNAFLESKLSFLSAFPGCSTRQGFPPIQRSLPTRGTSQCKDGTGSSRSEVLSMHSPQVDIWTPPLKEIGYIVCFESPTHGFKGVCPRWRKTLLPLNLTFPSSVTWVQWVWTQKGGCKSGDGPVFKLRRLSSQQALPGEQLGD